MGGMRRAGILLVALGYGFSFVAACLAACLMGPMLADHSCCAGEDGIRAVDSDCCSVTPGVAHGARDAAIASPPLIGFTPHQGAFVQPVAVQPTAAEVAASPPLVLRV